MWISRRDFCIFFFSSRRRHTRCLSDWSSDVCSSDLNKSHLQLNPLSGNYARLLLAHTEQGTNTTLSWLSVLCSSSSILYVMLNIMSRILLTWRSEYQIFDLIPPEPSQG